VPTGDAEEEAIASRALHSKDHKDFANCELSREHSKLLSTDMFCSKANRPRPVLKCLGMASDSLFSNTDLLIHFKRENASNAQQS
jgi:hypothetical protein